MYKSTGTNTKQLGKTILEPNVQMSSIQPAPPQPHQVPRQMLGPLTKFSVPSKKPCFPSPRCSSRQISLQLFITQEELRRPEAAAPATLAGMLKAGVVFRAADLDSLLEQSIHHGLNPDEGPWDTHVHFIRHEHFSPLFLKVRQPTQQGGKCLQSQHSGSRG